MQCFHFGGRLHLEDSSGAKELAVCFFNHGRRFPARPPIELANRLENRNAPYNPSNWWVPLRAFPTYRFSARKFAAIESSTVSATSKFSSTFEGDIQSESNTGGPKLHVLENYPSTNQPRSAAGPLLKRIVVLACTLAWVARGSSRPGTAGHLNSLRAIVV